MPTSYGEPRPKTRGFLIQTNWNLYHEGSAYYDPTVHWSSPEEVLIGGYYFFPGHDFPGVKGKQFPKVRRGDMVLAYFTKTDDGPYSQEIPFVYEVTSVDFIPVADMQKAVSMGWCTQEEADEEMKLPRILRLHRVHAIDPPVTKQEVDSLVAQGVLSHRMRNRCGNAGFNIGEIGLSDLNYFLGL